MVVHQENINEYLNISKEEKLTGIRINARVFQEKKQSGIFQNFKGKTLKIKFALEKNKIRKLG